MKVTAHVKGFLANRLMRLFGMFPLQDICVFSAFEGKIYGDNPKAIYEEMIKRNLPYKYIWLIRDNSYGIPGAITVRPNSIRGIFYLSVARIWIDCTRKSAWVVKRRGQFYVQTWHGDICLKRIEKDAGNALSRQYICAAKNDSAMADLMLSGSKFRSNNYRDAFWYGGEILECGTPKTDSLFLDKDLIRHKVRKSFSLPDSSSIAIYLPTFRSVGTIEGYFNNWALLVKALSNCDSDCWAILKKLHPNIAKEIQYISPENESVIDASAYENTNELIAAADLIITDYSSCMFDALEIDIPVILYVSDYEDYVNDRGLYFDLDELPFIHVSTSEELATVIQNKSYLIGLNKYDDFRKRLGFINKGNSSQRVVDEVLARITTRSEVC